MAVSPGDHGFDEGGGRPAVGIAREEHAARFQRFVEQALDRVVIRPFVQDVRADYNGVLAVEIRVSPVQEAEGYAPIQGIQPGIIPGEGQGVFFVIARGDRQSGRGRGDTGQADAAAQFQDPGTGGRGVLEQVTAETDRRGPDLRPVGQAFILIVEFRVDFVDEHIGIAYRQHVQVHPLANGYGLETDVVTAGQLGGYGERWHGL